MIEAVQMASEKFRAHDAGRLNGLRKISYSMVKIACLNDASSEIFELEATPGKGQSLQQKDKKRRKRKGGKKSILSCCKCLFEYIGANLAHIQAENLQNVQKMRFWQKAQAKMS